MTSYSTRPKILSHLTLILVCLIVGFPLIFTIVKSTQNISQIMAYPPDFSIGNSILQNYSNAITGNNFPQLMGNTLLVAGAVMLGKTVLSLLAGTAFVYFRFPLRGPLFIFVLLTLLMPTDILVVALFRLMFDLHWSNQLQALIVPFLASATGTLLFRQHFSNIPAELADAAQIDGAGALRYLFSILVPMSWNIIDALGMI